MDGGTEESEIGGGRGRAVACCGETSRNVQRKWTQPDHAEFCLGAIERTLICCLLESVSIWKKAATEVRRSVAGGAVFAPEKACFPGNMGLSNRAFCNTFRNSVAQALPLMGFSLKPL